MGVFKKFGQRFSEGTDQQRAQEIRALCADLPDVQQIAECRPRTRPRIAGVVQSITVVPASEAPVLKVEVFDGTDKIVGTWYGRRRIPGINLGQPLVMEGTIRKTPDETLEMINPAYELVPSN